ncbi:MAG: phage major capsid protein [Clostridiales bacterium]|nr:phage major capsid protein [Clostridiales bacterium]
MVTIESADNALKSFYLDAVTEAIDKKANPLLARIAQSTTDVVGKDVKKLVKLGVNGGISAGSETGALPTASSETSVMFTTTLKNLYGTIEISDKALRASANSEGAFVNLLNSEMQDLIKSANFNFGRMLYGDGSGRIGIAKGLTMTDNVLEMTDMSGMVEGLLVDFYSADGTTVYGRNYLVVHVDRENKTVRFTGAKPLSMVIAGESLICIHNSFGYEITGLKAIFEADTLYGVDRTKNPALMPYIHTEVGAISENVIQKAMDAIEEVSGSQVNFIVCSWGVKRALSEYYKNLGVALPTMKIEGGFNALNFNGVPVVADRFCPEGTMYLLNTDDFKLHQLCDWKWLEGEDGKVLKQVPTKPVFTATLVKYAELMCERPNGQGMLSGITEA